MVASKSITKTKILGVGLSKTGTKSLAQALSLMGYKVCHYPSHAQLFSGDYDAYIDTPVLAYLNELFDRYDDTKLIYTCRDYGDWIKSCYNHMNNHPTCNSFTLEVRRRVYNSEQPSWKDLDIAYKHFQSIFTQLDNVLILPLESKLKFDLLADFLDCERPKVNYPHVK